MITAEAILKKLKERGLKLTSQRRAVVEALVELGELHPGAHAVYEKARKKKKSLSLSTTYATLSELSVNGIVKLLQFDRMEDRYDGNLDEHVNLVCVNCGKIADYKAPFAAKPGEVMKKTGFAVTDTRLEYYGLCRECREAQEGKKGR